VTRYLKVLAVRTLQLLLSSQPSSRSADALDSDRGDEPAHYRSLRDSTVRRAFRLGGITLTVDVARGADRALRGRQGQSSATSDPVLEFVSPLPRLELKTRDADRALEPYRSRPPASVDLSTLSADDPSSIARLQEVVRSRYWYHTIELPGGVVTQGEFDHRELVPHYGLPNDLTGQRALDIASYDGFWAFEMERRGAEVTSVDVERISQYDFPIAVRQLMKDEGVDKEHMPGFDIARHALGSRVRRITSNVYDLDAAVHGTFDFVHVADLLLHLESPTRALRAIRSVTASKALIVDVYDPALDDRGGRQLVAYQGGWDVIVWWLPSLQTLAQMIVDSGFRSVQLRAAYELGRACGERGLHRAVFLAEV
jgi:tRNA (mo5U34)-methyltransferase